MTPAPLPESSPSRHGVDPGGISAFLDAVDGIELHSLMILRHGHVIASGWWEPYGADRPHLLYSLSKSFTSTAAGLAVAEGLLDLDVPVLSYFPELDADVTDPRSRAMLVRHIASMSSGHVTDTWPAAPEADPVRPVRGFLRIPPERDPGTVFAYNQACTYTLASILQRVTGQPLTAYLHPRLFDPIGIGPAAWDEFPPGQALGFSGLYATTDAIARLGELYLRGGQWHGRQVIPAEWVAEATRPHIATAPDATFDWGQGYGFQFWMSRHGYRGDGAYGQFCLVLPEHDAVVAITAGTGNMQGVLDAVWNHVLPAFGTPGGADAASTDAGTADAIADAASAATADAASAAGADAASPADADADAGAALAKRLAQLRLPPHGASGHGSWPDDAAPIALTPAGGVCEALPSLRRIQVQDRNITLSEDALSVELRLTDGGWHVTESPVPAAASGGWTAPGTLAIDVLFLETPHRLSLTCSLQDRTFLARWHTQPLSRINSMTRLRSPGMRRG